MSINSIMVAADLSSQKNCPFSRARHFARIHGASLALMHVKPYGEGAEADAGAWIAKKARKAENDLQLPVKFMGSNANTFDDLVAAARGVDLVVMPCSYVRSVKTFFMGNPVVRLLRQIDTPVLATRDTRKMCDKPFERIVVMTDFSSRSAALASFAASLDVGAHLEIFHAISTRDEAMLRSAEATEQVVKSYREGRIASAREKMVELINGLALYGKRPTSSLGFGDAARQAVLHQQRSGADLIVVGNSHSSALCNFLGSSIAERVLNWGSSDVLVVPDAYLDGRARISAPPAG